MTTEQPHRQPLLALDDADRALFTVGQVAELLGVAVAQLRRLDDLDVVRPGRSGGNQRRYSRHQIERLRDVLALASEGLTLAGVRRVLALQDRVTDLEGRLAKAETELAARRQREPAHS